MKGLTVNVENKSNKNINYVSVLIVYSRVENDEASNEAPLGDSIPYGVSPFRKSSAPAQVHPIPPGGSIDLALTERAYDENVVASKNLKYKKSVRRIELSVEEVGFEDGTAWSKGQYWKPDPDKPGQWLPLEQEVGRSTLGRFFFRKASYNLSVNTQGETCNRRPSHPFYTDCSQTCEIKDYEMYEYEGFGERATSRKLNLKCTNKSGQGYCNPIIQSEVEDPIPPMSDSHSYSYADSDAPDRWRQLRDAGLQR